MIDHLSHPIEKLTSGLPYRPIPLELAAEFESEGVPTRLPTIVLEELYIGVGAGKNANENVHRYEHSSLINRPSLSTRTSPAVREFSKVSTSRATPNRRSGPGDAIIAATGLVYTEPIVTNDGDFESVDGLRSNYTDSTSVQRLLSLSLPLGSRRYDDVHRTRATNSRSTVHRTKRR